MRHFNKLSPGQAERLALLLEELGEAQQAIGKVLRHGYESHHPDGGPTNQRSLERELGHIMAAIDLLCGEHEWPDLARGLIDHARSEKHKSVQKYMHHQLFLQD